MNDKEMIEEMAKFICSCASPCDLEDWDDCDKMANCPKVIKIAKELHLANYRKIPEGAVVLTGTESEEYFADLLIEFDEMGFEPTITMPNAEEYAKAWKKKMVYAIRQLRKETARKLLKEIDKELYKTSRIYLEAVIKDSKNYDAMDKYGVMTIAHDILVKIAEQFGVEIKE